MYVSITAKETGRNSNVADEKETAINIFGLMSKNNELEAYECEGSRTSAVVIAFIDDFLENRKTEQLLF